MAQGYNLIFFQGPIENALQNVIVLLGYLGTMLDSEVYITTCSFSNLPSSYFIRYNLCISQIHRIQ